MGKLHKFYKAQNRYILLTGGDNGFGNLGDEFILEGVKKFYKPYLKTHKIIILKHILPSQPHKGGFIYELDYRKDFENLNIPIESIDLVHYYGGGYLNTYWYKDKIWLYKYLTNEGLSPKKFVFTGHGLGPFSKTQTAEIKDISNKVLVFGSRDYMGAKDFKRGLFSFDDTINLINPSSSKYIRKKIIGINLRPQAEYVGADDSNIVKILKDVNKFAANNGYKIYFFNMVKNHLYDEIEIQDKLIVKAGIKQFKMFDRPKDYKELLKIIDRSKLIITTSYHSSLAALYSKVPVISLYASNYYALKFKGLKECFPSKLLNTHEIKSFRASDIQKALNDLNQINIKETSNIIKELKEGNSKIYGSISKAIEVNYEKP